LEQTAIFHANGAMDEPDDEALAFLFAEAADRAGLGRFQVEDANVERLDAWVPVWSRGAHAVLRNVLLDWESFGIVGVGRSGAFSPLDPGEEVSLALRYRDADALNQRETHRVYLDPPVRVEDLDVHITRFVER